ncbi:MAG: hypothetical protein E6I55_11040 [Chloroflexi bacterium]|nr:MAG: hypothetical protein E6I55_11040 [Chloroflexota bacterium]
MVSAGLRAERARARHRIRARRQRGHHPHRRPRGVSRRDDRDRGRTLFGSLVRVCDRGKAGAGPVLIGDDVWIAHGAIIEPGVTIGSGSVVAAGSVVSCDVPPGSLAIGNPARCMSLSLRSDEPRAADERGLPR